MKIRFLILIILGLLVSCAQMNPHPMDMTQAVRNAKTSNDHTALAKHYEEAAKEMQSKVDEHKKMLEGYESNTSHYGKQAAALQSHCKSLIMTYEQATTANMDMANAHRAMAVENK